MTPETAPDRLVWLSGAAGVNARGAVSFNGTNQRLTRASSSTIQAGGGNFALGGWFRLKSTPGSSDEKHYLDKFNSGSNQREYTLSTFGTNAYRLAFSTTGATVSFIDLTRSLAADVGVWVFLFAYFRSSNGQMGLSVNGNPFVQTTMTGGPIFAGTSQFQIAARDGSNRFADIDADSAFLCRPPNLSDPAALRDALFNGGNGRRYDMLTTQLKTDLGLVSFWDLDEATGDRLDSHGPNHLTPVNGPLRTDGKVEGPANDLDPVRSWANQAGGGGLFVQDTIANRPTHRTAPARVVFDGIDDRLSRVGPMVGDRAAFTILARVRPDALPSNDPAVIFTEADAVGNVVNRIAISGTGHVVASYRPAGGTLASATSAAPLAVGNESVVAVRRSGTALQVFIDGQPSGSAATIGAGTDLTGATLRVGGPVESTGLSHLNGRIASIFASGQALTDAQVAGLSGNL